MYVHIQPHDKYAYNIVCGVVESSVQWTLNSLYIFFPAGSRLCIKRCRGELILTHRHGSYSIIYLGFSGLRIPACIIEAIVSLLIVAKKMENSERSTTFLKKNCLINNR